MKFSSLKTYSSNFLHASDFSQKMISATIKKYEVKNFQGKEKLVLNFNEIDSGLVLNHSNSVILGKAFGDELDDWVNKPVTMWVEPVMYNGGLVNSIKVKPSTQSPATKLSDIPAQNDEGQ